MSTATERKRAEIVAELTLESEMTGIPVSVLFAAEIVRLLRSSLGLQINGTNGQGGGRPNRSNTGTRGNDQW